MSLSSRNNTGSAKVRRAVRAAAFLLVLIYVLAAVSGCSKGKNNVHTLPTATDPNAVEVVHSQRPAEDTAAPTQEATPAPTEAATEPAEETGEPTEAPTSAPTEAPQPTLNGDGYPAIVSTSGTIVKYGDTGVFRVDNTGFEGCGYVDSIARAYMDIVNTAADKLSGRAQVYSLIIPTSYAIMIPDDVKDQVQYYVDQAAYIDTAFGYLNSNVKTVRCFNRLMQHRNEYIYFRTDHHWTQRGAYYAYEAFCSIKGVNAIPLSQREELQFDGFLGTFYQLSGSDSALMPADTVYAYKPVSTQASMVFYEDGKPTGWPIIQDVSTWNASSKYSAFAGSDHGLTEFTNPQVSDGVLIILKDSFGNALLPLLVDHYSKIYEIDYRYWTGNLVDFAREKGATDIVFANNFHNISNRSTVAKLTAMM